MELRKYSYERLDGSVRAEERFAAIRNFSASSSMRSSEANGNDAFVFMISTRAGGVGLNLVAADTVSFIKFYESNSLLTSRSFTVDIFIISNFVQVIFYEQDWNPQVDKQALQRAHRIGQMNHVLSINLVTRHSVEEVMFLSHFYNLLLLILNRNMLFRLSCEELRGSCNLAIML